MRPKYREFLGQVVVRDVSGLGFRVVLHAISTHANDYMTLVVAVSTLLLERLWGTTPRVVSEADRY